MKPSYVLRYWSENEFGDIETYGNVYASESHDNAVELCREYRELGWHTRLDVVYDHFNLTKAGV